MAEGVTVSDAAKRSGSAQQSPDAVARDKSDSHDGPPDKRAGFKGEDESDNAGKQHTDDCARNESGEPGWDRTIDTVIKSHVLYH